MFSPPLAFLNRIDLSTLIRFYSKTDADGSDSIRRFFSASFSKASVNFQLATLEMERFQKTPLLIVENASKSMLFQLNETAKCFRGFTSVDDLI